MFVLYLLQYRYLNAPSLVSFKTARLPMRLASLT